MTTGGGGVGGGVGSDRGTCNVMGMCVAGVGSEIVDNALVRLAVQSQGAEDAGQAGNDGLRQWGPRSAGWVQGVKHMPISSPLSIGSACAGYEAVGDIDAVLDMCSLCMGDAGRDADDGMRSQWSCRTGCSPMAPKSPQISSETLHAAARGVDDSTTTSGIRLWCAELALATVGVVGLIMTRARGTVALYSSKVASLWSDSHVLWLDW